MNAILPSSLKGNSNLKASWARRVFPSQWNSAQVLQCPRKGVGLGTIYSSFVFHVFVHVSNLSHSWT